MINLNKESYIKGSNTDLTTAYKLAEISINNLLETLENFCKINDLSELEIKTIKDHYSTLIRFSSKTESDYRKFSINLITSEV